MPKLRLTVAAVERFQPPSRGQIDYYDTHLPAFGVRVSYSGTKAWFVMTRVDAKLTRLTLGRHPALSLAQARDKAREAVEQARAGGDPRLVEAEARRLRKKERQTTFQGCAAMFMERHVEQRLRLNTAREYRRILQGPDTAGWRDQPVSHIRKDDIMDVLLRIEKRGSPTAANRALAYLSKFFGWCVEHDLLSGSPTSRVRALSALRSRERVLTADELQWVWQGLSDFPGIFGPLFRILVLTGQRRGEVAGMLWSELRDLGTADAMWEIPPSRTKNGQPHLVPLAPAVQAILEKLPQMGPLVFTTNSKTAASGFSKAKNHLDHRLSQLRAAAGLPPLPAWILHDLRRTMVTVMNERLGIAPHVVEAIVNHLSGPSKRGVAGVYNRALYLSDRRVALVRWSDYIE